MYISPELFQKDLLLGSQGSYLSISNKGLEVVSRKPWSSAYRSFNHLFSSRQDSLGQALNGKSVREIHNFAMNIVYAVEKSHLQLFFDQSPQRIFTFIDIKHLLKTGWTSVKTSILNSICLGLVVFGLIFILRAQELNNRVWGRPSTRELLWDSSMTGFLSSAITIAMSVIIPNSHTLLKKLMELSWNTIKIAVQILKYPLSSSLKEPTSWQVLRHAPLVILAIYAFLVKLPRFIFNFRRVCEELSSCSRMEHITLNAVTALTVGAALWTIKNATFHLTRFYRHQCSPRSKLYDQLFSLIGSTQLDRPDIEKSGKELARLDEFWKRLNIKRISKQDNRLSILTYRRFILFRQRMLKKGYYVVTTTRSLSDMVCIDFQTALAKRIDPSRDLSKFSCLHFSLLRDPISLTTASAHLESETDCPTLGVNLNPWDLSLARLWLGDQSNGSPLDHSTLLNHFSVTNHGKAFLLQELRELQTQVIPKEARSGRLQKVRSCASRILSPKAGALYAICIPEEMVDDPTRNTIYEITKWETPVDRDNPDNITKKLNKPWESTERCQGAILSPSLIPENGIKIKSFVTLSQNHRQEMRKAVESLVTTVLPHLQERPISLKQLSLSERQNLMLLNRELDKQAIVENTSEATPLDPMVKSELEKLQQIS